MEKAATPLGGRLRVEQVSDYRRKTVQRIARENRSASIVAVIECQIP